MEKNLSKLTKGFEPMNTETFITLFSGNNFVINKKHLLLLSLEKTQMDESIFHELPNSKIVFTKETFLIAIQEDFSSKKFSKEEICNIFANQNEELFQEILDLHIFQDILIIHAFEDYQKGSLNINQKSNLCYEILKNKSIKEKISIKYLLNENGELDEKLLNSLEICENLINYDKNKISFESPLFLLKFHRSILSTVQSTFKLRVFANCLVEFEDFFPNQEEIENLILMNGDFINYKIMWVILKTYYSFNDQNQEWLRKIFSSNEYYFSNLDIAKWIAYNFKKYKDHGYAGIKELHHYFFHDENVYSFFYNNNFFIEQLTIFSPLINLLE